MSINGVRVGSIQGVGDCGVARAFMGLHLSIEDSSKTLVPWLHQSHGA